MRKSTSSERRLGPLSLTLLLAMMMKSSSFSMHPNLLLLLPGKTTKVVPPTPLTITITQSRLQSVKHCIPITSNRSHLYSSSTNSINYGDQQEEVETWQSNSKRRVRNKPNDLYAILGATPSMSKSEIKRLYVTLAKQTHPDSTNNNSSTTHSFNEIARAYATLSDSKLRRQYDRELAAQVFTDDVLMYAQEIAREYGPSAKKFYEEFALPFIKKTTASTVAGLRVVRSEVTTESNGWNGNGQSGRDAVTDDTVRSIKGLAAPAGMKQNNGNMGLRDFGRVLQKVVEAGRNATRQIDAMELKTKSQELHMRADETRTESLLAFEQLTALKLKRLRLIFHTNSAEFSSHEALQYLDVLKSIDAVGIMGRMTFKHTVRQDIEALSEAEIQLQSRIQEQTDLREQAAAWLTELENAEKDVSEALMAESQARQLLEDAERRVTQSQKRVSEAEHVLSNMNMIMKRTEQELDKNNIQLKRKRDLVRRALRRKEEREGDYMNTFDKEDNGSIRLNSLFDKSSSVLSDMDYEKQNNAMIENLRNDEALLESHFLRLVEKTTRLISRSERLRLRSDELMGQQIDEQSIHSFKSGTIVGETFQAK